MQHYVRNFGIGGSVAFFLVKITPPYYTVRPQPQLPYHDHEDVDHYHHQNFHHINNHRAQPQPPTMPYHSQPTPTITTMMTTMTTTTNNTMRTTKFSDQSLTNTLDQCFYLYSTTIVTSITVLSKRRFCFEQMKLNTQCHENFELRLFSIIQSHLDSLFANKKIFELYKYVCIPLEW